MMLRAAVRLWTSPNKTRKAGGKVTCSVYNMLPFIFQESVTVAFVIVILDLMGLRVSAKDLQTGVCLMEAYAVAVEIVYAINVIAK